MLRNVSIIGIFVFSAVYFTSVFAQSFPANNHSGTKVSDVNTIPTPHASAQRAAMLVGVITLILEGTSSSALPVLRIADASLAEGSTGTQYLTFTVMVSAASARSITLNYATQNGSATSAIPRLY
jgi:hypothetical protein